MTVAIAGCGATRAPAGEPIETRADEPVARPAPARGRMVVTETNVEILDPIRFLAGSSALDARSTRVLDAIGATLLGNPSIRLVRVHAYGADALAQFQAQVGAERAQVVVDQLAARGVARSRLLPSGEAAPPAGRSPEVTFEIVLRKP